MFIKINYFKLAFNSDYLTWLKFLKDILVFFNKTNVSFKNLFQQALIKIIKV